MANAAYLKEELATQINFVKKGIIDYERFYNNLRVFYEMMTEKDQEE